MPKTSLQVINLSWVVCGIEVATASPWISYTICRPKWMAIEVHLNSWLGLRVGFVWVKFGSCFTARIMRSQEVLAEDLESFCSKRA